MLLLWCTMFYRHMRMAYLLNGKRSNMPTPGLDPFAGLDWVAQNAVKPAVVTLSLGIPAGAYSQTLDAAVRSLVTNSSITVVVASGAG